MIQLELDLQPIITMKWSKLFTVGDRYSFLKCHRYIELEGTWILGNQKYALKIISIMEMENANPSDVPISETRSEEENDDKEGHLDESRATIFRQCVGMARFDRQYRSDKNFTVKELSHALKTPHEKDWKRLKKYARYLKGTIEEAVWLPREGKASVVDGYGDSDWAQDKVTRKSTSSGHIFIGECIIADYARSQILGWRSE